MAVIRDLLAAITEAVNATILGNEELVMENDT